MLTYGKCNHVSRDDATNCPLCAENPRTNVFEPPPPLPRLAPPQELPPLPPLSIVRRVQLAALCSLVPAGACLLLFALGEHENVRDYLGGAIPPVAYFSMAFACAGWIQESFVLRYPVYALLVYAPLAMGAALYAGNTMYEYGTGFSLVMTTSIVFAPVYLVVMLVTGMGLSRMWRAIALR